MATLERCNSLAVTEQQCQKQPACLYLDLNLETYLGMPAKEV